MFINKLLKTLPARNTRLLSLCSLFIQLLILISIILITLETVPELAPFNRVFTQIENFIVFIFVFEYFVRIYYSQKKIKFIFSFFGLIDLVAILPSIATYGVINLSFLRSLRLLRIIRILKLARYSIALDRLKKAFIEIKDELTIFAFLTSIVIYISAAGIYYFESPVQPEKFKSIFHSLWWAVSTLTTVGYGDVYPITVGGKVFTFLILIVGLGVVSVPSALLASAFSKKH